MTYALAYIEKLGLRYDGPMLLSYHTEAIKAVNANLNDLEKATSNSNIAAVTGFLGNQEQLRIHMRALHKMLDLRGGLGNIASDFALHTMIMWVDLLYSYVVFETPCKDSTAYQFSEPPSLIEPDFDGPHQLYGGFAYATCEIRHLTSAVTGMGQSIDAGLVDDLKRTSEKRLLSLANPKPASDMSSLEFNLELCRLAALIYIKQTLRADRLSRPDTQELKARVMMLVREMEARRCLVQPERPQHSSHVQIWALFRTGLLAVDDEEEEWFATRVAHRMRGAGMVTWKDLEVGLQRVCWRDEIKADGNNDIRTEKCNSLWRKVEKINESYWKPLA
ncbi:MAG: hypothetical protein Q9195_000425 [Heterodermia aff. obscurata]